MKSFEGSLCYCSRQWAVATTIAFLFLPAARGAALLLSAIAVVVFSGEGTWAADVTITVSKPLDNGDATVTFTKGNVVQNVPVPNITKTDSAAVKAAKIGAALVGAGFDVMASGASITISNLAAGTEVKFVSDKTGEDPDTQKAMKAVAGSIEFDGPFSALDSSGTNAIFTAGVSDDLGQDIVNLKSTQVSDLSGPGITASLFAALDPGLPPGVSAFLSGSDIIFDFALQDTLSAGAEVEFGTTSGTGDVEGSLDLVPEPPSLALLAPGVLVIGLARRWPGRNRQTSRCS
jgi:hypothetical protein